MLMFVCIIIIYDNGISCIYIYICASLVDGSDVESGKLTIRMFKGACCQGRPTATQILFLNECLLDNQGSVKV